MTKNTYKGKRLGMPNAKIKFTLGTKKEERACAAKRREERENNLKKQMALEHMRSQKLTLGSMQSIYWVDDVIGSAK